jgi:hypothetical protein
MLLITASIWMREHDAAVNDAGVLCPLARRLALFVKCMQHDWQLSVVLALLVKL